MTLFVLGIGIGTALGMFIAAFLAAAREGEE